MGLYNKYVLPRLVDLSMRNKETSRLRAEWLHHARGDVLEVGIGSGLNLPFYSSAVQRVYGVDPSLELQRMALKRATATHARVEFLSQSTEDTLPLEDGTIDTVVMTWTLCSISRHLKSPTTDEACSQREGSPCVHRTWPFSGSRYCGLAGQDDTNMEADRGRLPSEP